MKARIPTPLERLQDQRKKGRELIENMRAQGLSDEDIAKKLGVPFRKWAQFLWQIGMPLSSKNKNFKDFKNLS